MQEKVISSFSLYQRIKKSELRQKWQEYQKLPESERARLRADSPDTYKDADLN